MKSRFSLAGAFALLAIVGAQVFAQAPAAPEAKTATGAPAYAVLPDNVLGFAVVNRLSETDAKISDLAKQFGFPVPSPLGMLKLQTGATEGLDDKGSLIVAMFAGETEDGPPLTAFFVPVTDYNAFIAQFAPADSEEEMVTVTVAGRQYLAAERGGCAVFGPPDRGPELTQALESSKSVASSLKPLEAFVTRHDAAVVVTPRGLELLITGARKGLKQASADFEKLAESNPSMAQAQKAFGMYDQLLQAIDGQVTHFAAGAIRDKAGHLHFRSRSVFKPGSDLAAMTEGVGSPPANPLQGLPAGAYLFAFEGVLPEKLLEASMQFSVQMMQGMGGVKSSEAESREMAHAMLESIRGVESMSFVMGVPTPGKSLYSSMVGVMHMEDSAKFLASYGEAMEKYNELAKKGSNPLMPPYETRKAEFDGLAGFEMTIDMSAMLKDTGASVDTKVLEMLAGPDGKLNAYIVAVNEKAAVFTYDKDQIAVAVENFKSEASGLASDANLQKTRKLLPPESQWAAYLDVQGIMQFGQQMVALAAPGGGATPAIPPFPKAAPIGMAARAQKGTLTTDLVIPAPLLKTLAAYMTTVQEMHRGSAPPATEAGPIRAEPELEAPSAAKPR